MIYHICGQWPVLSARLLNVTSRFRSLFLTSVESHHAFCSLRSGLAWIVHIWYALASHLSGRSTSQHRIFVNYSPRRIAGATDFHRLGYIMARKRNRNSLGGELIDHGHQPLAKKQKVAPGKSASSELESGPVSTPAKAVNGSLGPAKTQKSAPDEAANVRPAFIPAKAVATVSPIHKAHRPQTTSAATPTPASNDVSWPPALNRNQRNKWSKVKNQKGVDAAMRYASNALEVPFSVLFPQAVDVEPPADSVGHETNGSKQQTLARADVRRPSENPVEQEMLRRVTATKLIVPPKKRWVENTKRTPVRSGYEAHEIAPGVHASSKVFKHRSKPQDAVQQPQQELKPLPVPKPATSSHAKPGITACEMDQTPVRVLNAATGTGDGVAETEAAVKPVHSSSSESEEDSSDEKSTGSSSEEGDQGIEAGKPEATVSAQRPIEDRPVTPPTALDVAGTNAECRGLGLPGSSRSRAPEVGSPNQETPANRQQIVGELESCVGSTTDNEDDGDVESTSNTQQRTPQGPTNADIDDSQNSDAEPASNDESSHDARAETIDESAQPEQPAIDANIESGESAQAGMQNTESDDASSEPTVERSALESADIDKDTTSADSTANSSFYEEDNEASLKPVVPQPTAHFTSTSCSADSATAPSDPRVHSPPTLRSFASSLRSQSYSGIAHGLTFIPTTAAKPTTVLTTSTRENVRSVFDRFSAFVSNKNGESSDDDGDDESSSDESSGGSNDEKPADRKRENLDANAMPSFHGIDDTRQAHTADTAADDSESGSEEDDNDAQGHPQIVPLADVDNKSEDGPGRNDPHQKQHLSREIDAETEDGLDDAHHDSDSEGDNHDREVKEEPEALLLAGADGKSENGSHKNIPQRSEQLSHQADAKTEDELDNDLPESVQQLPHIADTESADDSDVDIPDHMQQPPPHNVGMGSDKEPDHNVQEQAQAQVDDTKSESECESESGNDGTQAKAQSDHDSNTENENEPGYDSGAESELEREEDVLEDLRPTSTSSQRTKSAVESKRQAINSTEDATGLESGSASDGSSDDSSDDDAEDQERFVSGLVDGSYEIAPKHEPSANQLASDDEKVRVPASIENRAGSARTHDHVQPQPVYRDEEQLARAENDGNDTSDSDDEESFADDDSARAARQLQSEFRKQQAEIPTSSTALVPDSTQLRQQPESSSQDIIEISSDSESDLASSDDDDGEAQQVIDSPMEPIEFVTNGHFTPINQASSGAGRSILPSSSRKANISKKRQPSVIEQPAGGTSSSQTPNVEPTAATLEPPIDGIDEEEDIFKTVDEIAREVFNSTRPLPSSKPDQQSKDEEDLRLTDRSSDRALTPMKVRRRYATEVHIPWPPPSTFKNVIRCYSAQIPEAQHSLNEDTLELKPVASSEINEGVVHESDIGTETGPQPVGSDELLSQSNVRTETVQQAVTNDEPQQQAEAELDAALSDQAEQRESNPVPLGKPKSSSTLSDLSESPSPPPEMLRSLLPQPTQGDGRPDSPPSAHARKKRKMTGMTSKHFSPDKRPKTNLSAKVSIADTSSEVQQAAVLGEVIDAAATEDDAAGITPATKRAKPKRKSTGTKSDHFLPLQLLDRVDLPTPTRGRVLAGVSRAPVPPITAEGFGIVQERLWNEPFWLLIAVTFLNKTAGRSAVPTLFALKDKYKTPEGLAAASQPEVCDMIRHLGLQNQRSTRVIKMAQAWLDNPPVAGKRYRTTNYPEHGDQSQYRRQPIIEGDTADCKGALEIGHMPGCQRYAYDSWRIFCRDVLRGVAEDYKGKGTQEEGFQPEWQRVLAMDKELIATLRWMWLREGWIWDCKTGDRRRATDEEMERALKGEMDVQDPLEKKFAAQAAGIDTPKSAVVAPSVQALDTEGNEEGEKADAEEVRGETPEETPYWMTPQPKVKAAKRSSRRKTVA